MNLKTHPVDGRSPAGREEVNRKFDLTAAVKEITEEDRGVYLDLVRTELTPAQVQRVVTPNQVYRQQREVLAVHWHPEWIPLDLARRRIENTFPGAQLSLIIPTQHNELQVMGDYAGVEVDCYASGFNRKVQLLLHFRADRLTRANAFKSMLEHTFKYRSGQLFEYMDSVIGLEFGDRLEAAAAKTGANEEVVALTRFYVARLKRLMMDHEAQTPVQMIKNKLVPEFLHAQRGRHSDVLINRALLLVQAVKEIVKRHYSLAYFFRASEVIEETRRLGGGVIIPHPEQFWPILLAEYDVDGVEVWNPQSQEYTEFLVRALHSQNRQRSPDRRRLLIFMGDDTHLSTKIRDFTGQDRSPQNREVGLQPAWDDVGIRKSLDLAGASRAQVIEEYRQRIS